MLGCRGRKASCRQLSLHSWSFCSPVCRDRKSLPEPVSLVLCAAAAAKHPSLENEKGKGNVSIMNIEVKGDLLQNFKPKDEMQMQIKISVVTA